MAEFYEWLGEDYDHMVKWESRIAAESPFLLSVFEGNGVRSVLDIGCGTGGHSAFLSLKGFDVTAVDVDERMLDIAKSRAKKEGANVRFLKAGFGEISGAVQRRFDAAICLGNTLVHVRSSGELLRALQDVYECLGENGVFIVQIRNFDRVYAENARFLPLSVSEKEGRRIIFMRFYDLYPKRVILNLVKLKEGPTPDSWSYEVGSSKLYPIFRDELIRNGIKAGFNKAEEYGDFSRGKFDKKASVDLIAVFYKR